MWTATYSVKVYTLCKGRLTRKTAALLDFAQITTPTSSLPQIAVV